MKNKTSLLFVLGLVLVGLLVNSCKKDNQGTIETLLTAGKWQLASVVATVYLGDATLSTTTLNTTCDTTQIFSFNTDNSCTYSNFDCIPQTSSGRWSLSADKLTLSADMTCRDTTAVGTSKPFVAARIINLGQYSMVLDTGNIQTYDVTKPRTIVRYGFVHQKTTIK
ncbi:MAG: DUF5004 domain-containing protein [Mucilaginibacter sp.]